MITDAPADAPRLDLRYPGDLRPAKRAPLHFDGHESVLIVDPHGRARTETRLHHLIDTEDLDEFTLARIATLDGATIVHRDGTLLAYAAVVTVSDSQHEGARTAAARTLSRSARVVLKVSVDGDITIFQGGSEVATLLGRTTVGGH